MSSHNASPGEGCSSNNNNSISSSNNNNNNFNDSSNTFLAIASNGDEEVNRISSSNNHNSSNLSKNSTGQPESGIVIDFLRPEEGSPAYEALAANAALKVTKLDKGLHKLRGITTHIGPKMKNLNIIKQLKKHTKNKRNKYHFSRNFKGKVISGLHELYTLTAGIMHGIRYVVGRSPGPTEQDDLSVSDFNCVEKLVFPAKGNLKPPFITPPHGLVHTFKFKSYAPKVFKRLRDFYNIDPLSYMLSVCGNYNYLEFISNSKSGQFFFYTHDGKYMLKTQTKEENKFMRHILPHYFKYLTENPHSTFCRVLGMHRVKMYHIRRKVHFVIMASVFDSPEEIHTIYDLKGSTIGRLTKEAEVASGGVLKDLNLLNSKQKFHLGSKKASFMEQVSNDAYFLASLNIMDYSMLVGVHDRKRRVVYPSNASARGEEGGSADFEKVDGSPNSSSDNFSSPQLKEKRMRSLTPFRTNARHTRTVSVGAEKLNDGRSYSVGESTLISNHETSDDSVANKNGALTMSDSNNSSNNTMNYNSNSSTNEVLDESYFTENDAVENENYEGEHYDDGDSSSDEEKGNDIANTNADYTKQSNSNELLYANSGNSSGSKSNIRSQSPLVFGENIAKSPVVADGTGASGFEGADLSNIFASEKVLEEEIAEMRRSISCARDWEVAIDGDAYASGVVGDDAHSQTIGIGGGHNAHGLASALRPPRGQGEVPPEVIQTDITYGKGHTTVHPWTGRRDLGINSRVLGSNKRGDEIYYMGIIDILQEYNWRKRSENFFKGIVQDRTKISAVDALSYAKRFIQFMDDAID